MKLASFDIGIKNMAVCVFEASVGSPPIIQKWEILNLMNETTYSSIPCQCELKTKKNEPPKYCGKKSKYEKNGKTYCEKHAKTLQWIIPEKTCSPAHLKKQNYESLLGIAENFRIFRENEVVPTTKKDILQKVLTFFEENSYHVLEEPKKKTANNTDLISIGKNMMRLLDEIPEMTNDTITHVILENQIGILANRMKTIQGMLAQYFIMRGRSDIHIEFVSSSNKLKDLAKDCENNNYKQHKKDGIFFCKQFLEKNEGLSSWANVLETTKRDDLADCFLQGIWYLKREKIISYAEDLKINSILLS
jgi:hypothetical protein